MARMRNIIKLKQSSLIYSFNKAKEGRRRRKKEEEILRESSTRSREISQKLRDNFLL